MNDEQALPVVGDDVKKVTLQKPTLQSAKELPKYKTSIRLRSAKIPVPDNERDDATNVDSSSTKMMN